MEEQDGSNIQNSFFNKMRKDHARVSVTLNGGQRIAGFVKSFDRFTLLLDTRHGEQMIFKHAIATVSTFQPREAHGSAGGGGGERRPEEARREARGFGNFIEFEKNKEDKE